MADVVTTVEVLHIPMFALNAQEPLNIKFISSTFDVFHLLTKQGFIVTVMTEYTS